MGRAVWLWGPPCFYMVAIYLVSGDPDVSIPGGLSDKLVHGLVYAGLAALLTRALAGGIPRRISKGTALLAVTCTVAYGATDELHQRFVDNRVADVLELRADAVGACAGTAACWGWGILASRPSARRGQSSHDH